MRYQVIINFKVNTSAGIKEFNCGDVLIIEPAKAASLIKKGKIKPIAPCITKNGDLVIPFNSDSKYHWWAGGQRILDTLLELGADEEVIKRYIGGG